MADIQAVEPSENIDPVTTEPSELLEPSEDDIDSPDAYLWLLVFSTLMFTFPFLTFYGLKSWLLESFKLTIFQVNCFSVLASVLVVNFIICLYVFKAFREFNPPCTRSGRISVEKRKIK
uniref:Vacuolar ATPase assembly integral membrane protein VMA21 homolog n=1 Tax=Glossina brevipalpis TaxID=37001 RepID=A0A1A9W4M6_9MUSC